MHVVGKDIVQVSMRSTGRPFYDGRGSSAPPERVFAHGWWTIEGEKMSKSLGNALDPYELIESYGLDQLRYFLLREVPFGNDGDFSRAAVINRINADLANDYGNLCQRVLSMIAKNCQGTVPSPVEESADDAALNREAEALIGKVREHMEKQELHKALEAIFDVVGAANRYVDAQAPWALRKTDPERMGAVLYNLAETIRRLALLTQAFMPAASEKILDQLLCGGQPHARLLSERAWRPLSRNGIAKTRWCLSALCGRGRCLMLVDSHCHLDFPKLAEDREDVLARAEEAGVKVMQTIGTKLSRFPEILKIAEAHDNVWCSVGVPSPAQRRSGKGRPVPTNSLPMSTIRKS